MIDSHVFLDRSGHPVAYAFGTTHGCYARGLTRSDASRNAVLGVEYMEAANVTEGLVDSDETARRVVFAGSLRAGWRR